MCGDQQFKCLEESFRDMQFSISALGEHMPEVERSIQTVKSDVRTMYQSMPYRRVPPLVVKEMVEFSISMRNRFPNKNGALGSMSPLTVMTGLPNPSYHSFKIEFGQYVQTHDHPHVTNNMQPRTTPAIALGSPRLGNGWYFMNLETGKKILQYHWTTLPLSQHAIDMVHNLANKMGIKNKINNKGLILSETYEDRPDSTTAALQECPMLR